MIFAESLNFEAMLLNYMIPSITLIYIYIYIYMYIKNKCATGKSDWICKNCHKSLLKTKMPIQAQGNNMEFCSKFSDLDGLCPTDLILISQIIPFMFIVAKMKGAQRGLKEQCVLVQTDLKKIQTILPRTCDNKYLISLALKR